MARGALRRSQKRRRAREKSRGDHEVGRARSDARDDDAGAERADEPADTHGHAERREPGHESGGTDDVVRVALPRRMLDSAQRAGGERQQQHVRKGHVARPRQRAQRGGGDRLASPGQHQEPLAWKSVGEGAGRDADEEQGQHAHAHRDADEQRRVRQLEREPAEDDGLAHHPDGVEEHRHAETAKVGHADERGSKDGSNRAVESAPCPSHVRPRSSSTPATRSTISSC